MKSFHPRFSKKYIGEHSETAYRELVYSSQWSLAVSSTLGLLSGAEPTVPESLGQFESPLRLDRECRGDKIKMETFGPVCGKKKLTGGHWLSVWVTARATQRESYLITPEDYVWRSGVA